MSTNDLDVYAALDIIVPDLGISPNDFINALYQAAIR